MNVLIVPSWYSPKIEEQRGSFFREQAIALSKQGINVIVADVSFQGKNNLNNKNMFKLSKFKENGLLTYSLIVPSLKIPTFFPKIASKIAENNLKRIIAQIKKDGINIDIMHVHSFITIGAAAIRVAKKNNIPVVLTEHYSGILAKKLNNRNIDFLRYSIRNSNKVIAVSEALKKAISSYMNDKVDIKVIPNIVNKEFNYISSLDSDKFFYFVSVGNLVESKRFDLTIDAFCRLFKNNKNVFLKIIGDGPLKKELVNQVVNNNACDNIKFLGKISRKNVMKELSTSNVFILPSDYETFGVVYIEAMACGLPLIGTKNGGAEDIIKKENGLLVDLNNVNELTNAMNYIYLNYYKYDRKKISRNCIKKYGEIAISEEIIKIYKEIMDNKNKDDVYE